MSAFSSDEDLFREYDDDTPLSPIFTESNSWNSEFDVNEINGSAEHFFNAQSNHNETGGSTTITTTQTSELTPTESNDQNIEFDWDALNGTVGDFFNGLSNDNDIVEPTVTSTPQLVESPSIVSIPRIDTQSSRANSRRYSTDLGAKSSQIATRFNYEKLPGISSQRSRRFPDILPEDKNRDRLHKNGKNQLWFFILNLLNDFTKKSVITWTGNQRQFRISNTELFSRLWSKYKKLDHIKWGSIQRTLRTCGKNGILMAVPSTTHNGHNEDGLYGYAIEVSSYINMTREELDCVIKLHCETGPLTVGSPIDSSFGYPEGTKLQVMPVMPLDNDGNLLSPIPDNFITVLPQSTNNLNPSINSSSSVMNHPEHPTPLHPSPITTNSENVRPCQSTPLLNSLLNSNKTPLILSHSTNFILPPPPPAIHPMHLHAVNIDFSHIFNNDGTMNIHQWSDDHLIPSVVPLNYFNQSFPAQNQPTGANNQPFLHQNPQFQPQPNQTFQHQNHQIYPVNQEYQFQYQHSDTQSLHPQIEQFDPPF